MKEILLVLGGAIVGGTVVFFIIGAYVVKTIEGIARRR